MNKVMKIKALMVGFNSELDTAEEKTSERKIHTENWFLK